MIAKLALAVIGIYGALVLWMFLIQRQLQYLPTSRGLTPAALGLANVEEHALKTPDGETLVAWYSPPSAEQPVVLVLHGNGGEIGDRPERFRFFQSAGYGILYLSYRGYGGSTGSPTEAGLSTDALTAYDWLAAKGCTPERIVLIGESLGSGVAVKLASERRVAAVALEAPYTSTADVGARIYWWVPVRFLMKDQYRAIDRIAAIGAPLLVQHGDADTIIPIDFGRKLFDAAREPKEFHAIPGGAHEGIFQAPVWARELAFFQRHAG